MDLRRQFAIWKRRWRRKWHPVYDVINNGLVFFQEFADIYGGNIDSLDKFDEFMRDFMGETGGSVIVDMLDSDNWDCIRDYGIDKEKGILYLYWQVKETDSEIETMRHSVFPFDNYGIAIQFKNVQFIRDKKGICFAICINGYTIPDADIRKLTKTFDPSKSKIDHDSSFFSTNYRRIDVDPTVDMRIMKTPIKSFWIIPKGLGIHPQKSEELLYKLNLKECEEMIDYSIKACNKRIKECRKNSSDIETAIKCAGNQIRQADENLFKLIMCFYQNDYNFKADSYNNRSLGESIKPLKQKIYTTLEDAQRFNKIEGIANKCSHFTGLPVSIQELMELDALSKYYIDDFNYKICYGSEHIDDVSSSNVPPSPEPKEYIQNNYQDFDFNSVISPFITNGTGQMSYIITINVQGKGHFFILDGDVLCNDGRIHPLKMEEMSKAAVFWSRDDAVKVKDAISTYLSQLCEDNGFDGSKLWRYISFSIRAQKRDKPTHLFTEKEIHKIMAEGDDSVNNRLVIDEDGYAHLIQDTENGYLYPVYQETWGAEENAVGVQSTLSQCHESYIACMNCWLFYLESGTTIYADTYFSDDNIDEVIEKVRAYY